MVIFFCRGIERLFAVVIAEALTMKGICISDVVCIAVRIVVSKRQLSYSYQSDENVY